ncbi:uvrD/REP helicase N-terminal domain protein, partial [Vibrio parahaemolyticus V-223/04]
IRIFRSYPLSTVPMPKNAFGLWVAKSNQR